MINRIPVHYTEVLQAWREADNSRVGDSMLGIFWNVCPFVTQWYRESLTEQALSELRLIGGEPGTIWHRLSSGTFRVRECQLPEGAVSDEEPSLVALVAVEHTRTKRRTLLDGNKRAVCLWHRRQAGHPLPANAVLYVGVLDAVFEFAAAAASSLWR